jgi:hypothetical protein
MSTTAPPRWRRIPRTIATAPLVWLERARGRRRAALVLLYALVAMVPTAFLAREMGLSGLSDIGDPFDVAAFRAPRPDDALPLYREASEAYRQPSDPDAAREVRMLQYGAGRMTPAVRRWMADNAGALELWRRATERPNLGYRDESKEMRSFRLGAPVVLVGPGRGVFAWMAGVRAGDRAGSGDWAGAWAWHRARLRASRHVAMRAGFAGRMEALMQHRAACATAEAWAEEPAVDAALLRRALADALEVGAMTPPLSDMLKADYIGRLAELDDPPPKLVQEVFAAVVESGDATQWYRQLPVVTHFAWFLRNEPRRSRRLVRQVYANWLARCDEQPRAPMMNELSFELFASAPPIPGALSPGDLTRWLRSPSLADGFLAHWVQTIDLHFADERARQARLVVSLAEQLYRRERGAMPKSPAELVGPYLKALPDGFDEDFDASKDPGVDPAGPPAVRSR